MMVSTGQFIKHGPVLPPVPVALPAALAPLCRSRPGRASSAGAAVPLGGAVGPRGAVPVGKEAVPWRRRAGGGRGPGLSPCSGRRPARPAALTVLHFCLRRPGKEKSKEEDSMLVRLVGIERIVTFFSGKMRRYKNFVLLPLPKRRFCQECQQLLLPAEWEEHSDHQFLCDITTTQLKSPSQLLYPLENKKTNAQYLFADRSCQFLLNLLIDLGFRRVLSVGTPRVHEMIQSRVSQEEEFSVRSLLLDIDFRYSQFYTEGEFCHYNMFNHHFFGGEAARETCRKFLYEENGERVIMITDPPFGGLVEALASSFKKLMAMWKETEKEGHDNKEMPVFWIFPYFFESRILDFFPSFSMMDYQVDYDNHALYKHGKTGRRQSPVRIFTNLAPNMIVLPEEEGYRFCTVCQRYVSSGNQHCEICNSCTSKDGRRWKHCVLCKKCVKPSWFHCNNCNCCTLQKHSCEKTDVGCFVCGKAGHKRSACPSLSRTRTACQPDKKKGQKTQKRVKMGIFRRLAMKHAIFSKKKVKNKKKKT
ncbi:rRNA N6-adenosine-methyltransferase ZCCHC4 isoform X1 [Corvus kubaryi]|uniref:rRNA N6-adenosine-methyltransferase ZCCHC4 isoform X1 n=1 Tax=Corvus kubaryi TaxID=68294 RepID=UPI001C051095|nr:rRNA N6-adenosine-methyltransferase ZCCHC4 isoform X1 [Corvus kubaryi]